MFKMGTSTFNEITQAQGKLLHEHTGEQFFKTCGKRYLGNSQASKQQPATEVALYCSPQGCPSP